MAETNPKEGTRKVPIDITAEQRLILSYEIGIWLEGVEEDLRGPIELKDPEHSRSLVASYRRLRDALSRGTLLLPDEEARAALLDAAEGHDRDSNYEETAALHNAQRALLSVFEEAEEGLATAAAASIGELPDLAIEFAVLEHLLVLHPARPTESELIRELAGEAPSSSDHEAVERGARGLVLAGLAHGLDGFLTPSRAALHFAELTDR